MRPQAGLAEVPPLLATLGFLLDFFVGGPVGTCLFPGTWQRPVTGLPFRPLSSGAFGLEVAGLGLGGAVLEVVLSNPPHFFESF